MKNLFASAAIIAFAIGPAHAAEPSLVGDWLVKEGYANIRIDNCGGKMWGIVAWEKKPGGIDDENPDPAKKARPILGMPILIGLAPTEGAEKMGRRDLQFENGKTYSGSISMADENTLQLEGCLSEVLCQAQQWTRVKTPPAGAPPLPPIRGVTTGFGQEGWNAPSDTCLRVAEEAAALERANAKK